MIRDSFYIDDEFCLNRIIGNKEIHMKKTAKAKKATTKKKTAKTSKKK